jgi:hypothetical protein
MTAVKLSDSGNTVGSAIPMGGFLSTEDGLVFVDSSAEMTDPGEYALFLNVAGCSGGSNDFGVRVSTIQWDGLVTGICGALFDTSFNTSSYYLYSSNARFDVGIGDGTTSTTGELENTVGETTLLLPGVAYAGFDLEEYVFFLTNGSVSVEAEELPGLGLTTGYYLPNVPGFGANLPIVYVQDGGKNFENDNDIETFWSFTDNGGLRINIRNIPLSSEFNVSDESTYKTYYSWGVLSKRCLSANNNLLSEGITASNHAFYSQNSPWNDDYGVKGSALIDSLTQGDTLGDITVEAEIPVGFDNTFDPTWTSDQVIILSDFNNDGSVNTADLLRLLSIFGEQLGSDSQVLGTYYNDQGQYYESQGDLNGDGSISTQDLLGFLAAFGIEDVSQYYDDANMYGYNPTAQRVSSDETDLESDNLVDLAESTYGLSNIPSSITNLPTPSESYIKTSPYRSTVSIQAANEDIISYIKSAQFPANAQLFAFVAPNVSGDELRGQTAELLLDLGQEDFELFAVNLNYELLNADHTK